MKQESLFFGFIGSVLIFLVVLGMLWMRETENMMRLAYDSNFLALSLVTLIGGACLGGILIAIVLMDYLEGGF